MNNGKYDTAEYRAKSAARRNERYGPATNHKKICQRCRHEFQWEGRLRTKAYVSALFCSRKCANTRNGRKRWRVDKISNYRTICFRQKPKRCVICRFTHIVEVHHLNGNHKDNQPDNLIPLCPNHHEMAHTNKYEQIITKLLTKRGHVSK